MPSDSELVQIVDAALAEAGRRSGAWLACRAGCCECCTGPFPITQLDAARLRGGLAGLEVSDPARAARVRKRAEDAVRRMPARPAPLDEESFDGFVESLPEEEACPVLDPESGTCELYSARPITCRTFGPAIRLGGDALGTCHLCYEGASDEEIAGCGVDLDIAALEEELGREAGGRAPTLVALALITSPAHSPSSI